MVSPELLRRFPFFAGFTDKQLKELAMAGQENTLAKDETLATEGQTADKFYILVDGQVEISVDTDETGTTRVPLSTLTAGEPIGWSALVEPHIFTSTVRATRPCKYIAFEGRALQDMEKDHHFCSLLLKKLVQVVSRRLKDTRVQLLSFSAKPREKQWP